jgi:hypothetical protein
VVRSIPRGHFTEIVVELGPDLQVRAFAESTRAVGESVGLRWRRALVFSDSRLQGETGGRTADGART